MKLRKLLAAVVTVVLVVTVGCAKKTTTNQPSPPTTIQQQARDIAAALNGGITKAQAQYKAGCTVKPSQPVCTTINQAVAAQNALITADQGYCGWSSTAPADPNAPCVPVKGTEQALSTAISNANQLITELEGLVKP